MNSLRIATLATLGALATACSLDAGAVGRLADVSIIDRDTGSALESHYYRGEYWVAGRPGARYAIAIHNRRGARLLAVTSVDGVNVVSGETAGWGQTGYVFDAGQRYEIAGWRKGNAEVAAFEFTAAADAYATRTDRPANLGVIGVALFREQVVPQSPALPDYAAGRMSDAAPSAPAAASSSDKLEKLGTGHGEREHSEVWNTDFERLADRPDEIIRIRYDSLQNLVAMGVIPRPRVPVQRPDPFPDTPVARYVPDPPEYR